MKQKIIIIDDDTSTREALCEILERQGYEVEAYSKGREFLKDCSLDDVALVLTDLVMPDVTGMKILDHCLAFDADLPVIMVTGYGTVETAVEAMQNGAFHYLTKPVKTSELKALVARAASVRTVVLENRNLRSRVSERFAFSNIIGSSKVMESVFEKVQKVAPTNSLVLISGESGTGKELIANCIHENSRRAKMPYIKVNCAAIVESLLESELFGHKKGSFTGALADRTGKFEAGSGGTIFLDEISEMSITSQSKLLRVLQESEIEPVGDVHPRKIDVRVVAATNKNLAEEVKNGTFREDLYYRLKVVQITLPLLRERTEDIPLMATKFISEFNNLHNRNIEGISKEALATLRMYSWPGNVRELRNMIEGIVVITSNKVIEVDDLPSEVSAPSNRPLNLQLPVGHTLGEVEETLIRQTLKATGGNRTRTSDILGISLRTLQRKIKLLTGKGEPVL